MDKESKLWNMEFMPVCSADLNCGVVTVRMRFKRKQLLYDIMNYAYLESHLMEDSGDVSPHAAHLASEIGEDGNVDRVARILNVVMCGVTEMLYPYTKSEPVEEEMDDYLDAPDEYVIEMRVPAEMSRSTVRLLCRLIHEYLVYKVMLDWMLMMNPAAAGAWQVRADAAEREINSIKHLRRRGFVRRLSPW